MKYGLVFANFGQRSDPRTLADLAHIAEEAGWDGVFLPDALQMVGAEDLDTSDPWISLAAIAMQTERVTIGPIVAAPARYRPWQLARQATTLDHLSGGRLVLGIGLGDAYDRAFAAFHEEPDLRKRAAMLDESLEIIDGLWRGEPFQHDGEHYLVDEIAFQPRPLQRPRIPIWVGWKWPNQKPLQRAARWDGAVPFAMDGDEYLDLNPDQIREVATDLKGRRSGKEPFDIVAYGSLLASSQDTSTRDDLQAKADAGTTWLIEFIGPEHDTAALRTAIADGPPSLD
jgi:alkanesulfonate monooxygenase SsuD/methylene tetrahydromethanopterin reductase-like flavin-dependent oxidoreductase (luciferase family)